MTTIVLKCPQRSQVLAVYAFDGDMVTAGQRLISLDASAEEKYLATLDEHEAILKAHMNSISPNEINQRIANLQSVIDSYSRQNSADTQDVTLSMSFYLAGTGPVDSLVTAETSRIKSQESLLQSQIALAQLQRDVDISRNYIASALKTISKEQQYATRATERLSIKAPIRGKLSLYVGVNTPVRRGFVLAELS